MNKQWIVPAILFGIGTIAVAQPESNLPLVGVFKQIDVARHTGAIELLNGADKDARKNIIDSIMRHPNRYNPPVLYVLSRELFQDGRKDEAMYWFYLAQLRARYDANRCADNSAKEGVAALNMEYGLAINQYAFGNIDLLKTTVERVIAFVRTNDEDYDQRWLNLHGMWGVRAGLGDTTEVPELSEPKEQWKEIKAKTVDDYSNGFQEALQMLERQR